jgi:hypothetical protein
MSGRESILNVSVIVKNALVMVTVHINKAGGKRHPALRASL